MKSLNQLMDESRKSRIEEIDKQIGELVREKYQLVNPTEEERKQALENLVEDPYNNISILAEYDDNIADEVIAMRELDKEEEEEQNQNASD